MELHHRRLRIREVRYFCATVLYLVGRRGFAPLQSVTALLQSARLTHAQPTQIGTATGIRTLTTCLEGAYASVTPQRHGLVPSAGHDPATLRLRVACAAHLRHDGITGTAGGIQTPISSLKRRVLCQLSYSGKLILDFRFWILDCSAPQSKIQNPKSIAAVA